MPITSIRTETTVDKLITRVHGKLPAARMRELREAVLAANPHIAARDTLSPGTVVVVPPRDAATPPRRPPRGEAPDADDPIATLSHAIEEYAGVLRERLKLRAGALDDAERMIHSDEFRRDVLEHREARPLIDRMTEAMKVERAELAEADDAMAEDVRALVDALRKLDAKLD
jgi:phage tail protein X